MTREIKFRAILNKEARTRKEYGDWDWEKPIYFSLEDVWVKTLTRVLSSPRIPHEG